MTRYWLMKSEPDTYSIDTLKKQKIGTWDGVRNFQAKNFMKNEMKVGDKVLFYHSSVKPPGVAGVAEVCSEAYPDHTAFDPKSPYYDPKSTVEHPIWYMVKVKFIEKFPREVSLDEIRQIPVCHDMVLLKRGQRLSIQPIEKKHFDAIKKRASA